MNYQTHKFYRDMAELALNATTELDRNLRDHAEVLAPTVSTLLGMLGNAVHQRDGSILEFQAVYELYRDIIVPGSNPNLRTTDDLVEAIETLCDDWLRKLQHRDDAALHDVMSALLGIHEFCLSRSMGAHRQESFGLVA